MIGKNTKTFTITYKDDNGIEQTGQFTTKRLSIKDRAKIGVRKSQLTGGQYCVKDDAGNPTGQGIDEDTDYLNAMIAHLEISLVQKPTWFNLDEVAEIKVVQDVYQEVMDFEMSFFRDKIRENNPGEHDRVGQGNSGTESSGTGPGNTPTPVVDQKVQAALDA